MIIIVVFSTFLQAYDGVFLDNFLLLMDFVVVHNETIQG